MTKEFFAEYIKLGMGANSRTQRLLYILNPRKFRACEYLVKYHTKRGDKIIIFSDDVPALKLYCEALTEGTPPPSPPSPSPLPLHTTQHHHSYSLAMYPRYSRSVPPSLQSHHICSYAMYPLLTS